MRCTPGSRRRGAKGWISVRLLQGLRRPAGACHRRRMGLEGGVGSLAQRRRLHLDPGAAERSGRSDSRNRCGSRSSRTSTDAGSSRSRAHARRTALRYPCGDGSVEAAKRPHPRRPRRPDVRAHRVERQVGTRVCRRRGGRRHRGAAAVLGGALPRPVVRLLPARRPDRPAAGDARRSAPTAVLLPSPGAGLAVVRPDGEGRTVPHAAGSETPRSSATC